MVMPVVVAVVELEEGVRMVGPVIGVDPGTVSIGGPVRVVFEPRLDMPPLPSWRLEQGRVA
jgi:uncharacterized OB-fold protein